MRKVVSIGLLVGCLWAPLFTQAQDESWEVISLKNLERFDQPSPNWQLVSKAQAHLNKDQHFDTEPGAGILINLPEGENQGNLFSAWEHGDMDLELEFMMARHSNSGIYLQGRYEIQLLDSWGKAFPKFGDCGGIYQRWDDSKPEGEQGFEGYAPRTNASFAPGLWQKMQISFQAPRFDQLGKRTAPAKILSIHLNGQLIHENVVLTGPTRGPAFKEEAAKGPLMIQGDHGPVAFRNIRVRRFEPKVIRPENLSYKVYEGIFPVSVPNFDTLTAIQSGKMESLTQEVMQASDKISMHVKGSLKLPTKGTYFFQLTSRGSTMLKIGEKVIFVYGWWDRQATVELAEGEHAFELFYHKPDSWYPPGLGILMSGPGFRKQSLTSISSLPFNSPVNPISVQPGSRPKILRAFIDYPSAFAKEKRRIVHAISVGHAQKAHFTYDPDRASLVQAWRGGFLNTTPMWNNRGDGSARPLGTVLDLGDAADPGLLLKPQADWEATLAEQLGYKFRGYTLDDTGTPTFRYEIDGQMISDKISPRESEPGLQRSIGFPASMPIELHYRLAAGATIEEVDKNLYSIEGSYYVSIPKKQKVRIRSIGQHQEIILTAPANSPAQDLQYEIIW